MSEQGGVLQIRQRKACNALLSLDIHFEMKEGSKQAHKPSSRIVGKYRCFDLDMTIFFTYLNPLCCMQKMILANKNLAREQT